MARRIALEQTVELPEACVPADLLERAVGRIRRVEPFEDGTFHVVVEYPAWIAGNDLAQLLNLLFGNISLMSGVVVEEVDWPTSLLAAYPGPRHGVEGLRRLAGVTTRRPLLASALKPVGLGPRDLAHLAGELAAGGVDIIKDDHGLADQETAPLEERIPRCQEAVERANAATGGGSVYLPNVTGPPGRLRRAVELARSAGCAGVLVAPLLVGLDTVAELTRSGDLAVLAHPSLAGAFLRPHHGLHPALLLGRLFRLSGADGVIFPAPGGRFPPFDTRTCTEITRALRTAWGGLLPAAPVLAGGIQEERIPAMIDSWGPDCVFLVGGALLGGGDPRASARRLRTLMEEAARGR